MNSDKLRERIQWCIQERFSRGIAAIKDQLILCLIDNKNLWTSVFFKCFWGNIKTAQVINAHLFSTRLIHFLTFIHISNVSMFQKLSALISRKFSVCLYGIAVLIQDLLYDSGSDANSRAVKTMTFLQTFPISLPVNPGQESKNSFFSLCMWVKTFTLFFSSSTRLKHKGRINRADEV